MKLVRSTGIAVLVLAASAACATLPSSADDEAWSSGGSLHPEGVGKAPAKLPPAGMRTTYGLKETDTNFSSLSAMRGV